MRFSTNWGVAHWPSRMLPMLASNICTPPMPTRFIPLQVGGDAFLRHVAVHPVPPHARPGRVGRLLDIAVYLSFATVRVPAASRRSARSNGPSTSTAKGGTTNGRTEENSNDLLGQA